MSLMANEILELKDIVHNGTVANQYSNTLVSLHTKELQQFNTRYLHIYNILGVILYLLIIFSFVGGMAFYGYSY